jgi:hypothetical protein
LDTKQFLDLGMTGVPLLPGEKTTYGFLQAQAITDPATEAKGKTPANEGNLMGITVGFGTFYKSVVSDDWCYTVHVMGVSRKDRANLDPSVGCIEASDLTFLVMPSDSVMV